jgi:hypothetical protein
MITVLVGFVAFCALWRAQGGRWERVETPSMGTVAPVGTLLWVKPVAFDRLRVGDFVSFHPPGRPGVTYSHRVYAVHADGTLSTKGVIPAPDPWRLTRADVIGRVQMRWWGVGWLIAAAPILLGGPVLVLTVRALVGADWKLPVAVLLGSLVITVAIVVHRPLLNAQQLSFAPARTGGADATYVGTGLLPVRLSAHEGESVVMRDGQVGRVHVAVADSGHRFRIELAPAVPWWLWGGLVLGCFVPALVASRRDRRHTD